MEPGPFEDLSVLIDSLTDIKAEGRVRVHRRCLDERLELVSWMGRCSLDTEDFFKRLLSKNRISQSIGYMRELLILGPFDIMDGSPVGGVVGDWLVRFRLFPVLEVGRCVAVRRFSPPVEVLEVLVVQVVRTQRVMRRVQVFVLETRRHVALLVQVLRSDLGNVQVNEISIVRVDLHQLLLGQVTHIHLLLRMHAFMGNCHRGVSVGVSGRFEVVHPFVALLLALVHGEEEVRFCIGH